VGLAPIREVVIQESIAAFVPDDQRDPVFEEHGVGGRIPKQYIPSIEKGVRSCLEKGCLAEFPVVQTKFVLDDGSYHEVDSSDRAFQTAARDCFRETFPKTKPVLLEPIMRVEIECPEQFQGTVVGDVSGRRGIITSTDIREATTKIIAEVPLAETFGYATDLRSMTQGRATYSMEFSHYAEVPSSIASELAQKSKV
jgi:elongation factor G